MSNKLLLVGMLALAVVGFGIAGVSHAAITGSTHDFSGKGWAGLDGQICIVCHTPHNATSTIAPLWNHAVTSTTFTLYSSPSLNATVGQPSASSKACLSCHDGTVAENSFGGIVGTVFMSGSKMLGTDLSNDHPISFTYDAALATTDGGLNNPTIKTVADLGGKTIKDGMLIGDKVECSSCHDVHKNKGYAPSSSKLLLVNNSGSGLCLTCHNK